MKGHEELFSVAGKTAIVTGSSSGLGVVFAQTLARAGARVVLAARRVEKLQEVAREIQSNGGSAQVSACDVGDPAQVEKLVETAWSRLGPSRHSGQQCRHRPGRWDHARKAATRYFRANRAYQSAWRLVLLPGSRCSNARGWQRRVYH